MTFSRFVLVSRVNQRFREALFESLRNAIGNDADIDLEEVGNVIVSNLNDFIWNSIDRELGTIETTSTTVITNSMDNDPYQPTFAVL
jgi:hypothetical protein